MREFILRTSKASTDPNFDLENLPKAGRMDIVARCVLNSLFVSEKIREDVIFHGVLNGSPSPPRVVSFYSNKIKSLYPSEKGVAEKIRHALRTGKSLGLNEEKESESGIFISKKSFEKLVKEHTGKQIIYLHPNGKSIENYKFEKDFTIILSDYKRLPSKIEKFIGNLNIEKISLGRTEYLASQAINIVHYLIDREELYETRRKNS